MKVYYYGWLAGVFKHVMFVCYVIYLISQFDWLLQILRQNMQITGNTSIDPKGGLNYFKGSGALLYYFNASLTATSIWLIFKNCIDISNTQFSTSDFGYSSNWYVAFVNAWWMAVFWCLYIRHTLTKAGVRMICCLDIIRGSQRIFYGPGGHRMFSSICFAKTGKQ